MTLAVDRPLTIKLLVACFDAGEAVSLTKSMPNNAAAPLSS